MKSILKNAALIWLFIFCVTFSLKLIARFLFDYNIDESVPTEAMKTVLSSFLFTTLWLFIETRSQIKKLKKTRQSPSKKN